MRERQRQWRRRETGSEDEAKTEPYKLEVEVGKGREDRKRESGDSWTKEAEKLNTQGKVGEGGWKSGGGDKRESSPLQKGQKATD